MGQHLPKSVTLQDGETVQHVIYPPISRTWPIYLITLGLWEIWRRRHYFALTNQRLMYGHGVVMIKVHRSIPLARIQEATYTQFSYLGGVQISFAGGTAEILNDQTYSPKDARAFVEAVNEVMTHPGPGLGEESSVASAPLTRGAADDLRELAKLKDEGLLTDEEFAAKREELLHRL